MGNTRKASTGRRGRLRFTFIALAVALLWLVVGGIGGPYFGKIDEVGSNDLSTFLPKSAESTRVKDELEKFQDTSTIPAILVFESQNTLTDKQLDEIDTIRDALNDNSVVKDTVVAAVQSDDEKAAFLVVPLSSDAEFADVIPSIQETVANESPSMAYKLTGPAMFARDLNTAFAGIDGTLLFVALGVVFVILLLVYRSPLLPIVTLGSALLALSVAILLVWHLADAGVVLLNGQVQGILFILVIGAATDYALLYISRYREELLRYENTWDATKAAWKASWEPIVAAGGTVSLGLLCLLASDLGSNKALGPVGAIGVGFSVLSALTFLPAVLALLGRAAFWPRRPKYSAELGETDYHVTHPLWSKVGAFVGRFPRPLWIGITVLLLAACMAVPQLDAVGVSQDNLVLGESEARDGQAMLDRHFSSGSGSPTYVVAPKDDMNAVLKLLEADSGVDTVSVISTDTEKTAKPLGRLEDQIKSDIRDEVTKKRNEQLDTLRETLTTQMAGYPQAVIDAAYNNAKSQIPSVDELVDKAYPFTDVKAKVVDGDVVMLATLVDTPSSVKARDTVARLRTTIQPDYPSVLFGGVSAIQLDTNTASERDLKVIIPLILGAITIVLMLLLRAVVAPLVLLVTTVMSFGATLGIAALLFNNVWKFPGADPAVVIFGFVFLVALGIDYNIFLMTRVREETLKLGVRTGTLKALAVTGGVITSAGIVLASTFAALNVIPILFLAEIAFIVAFGVLLDTFIVRSLLVPSLTLEIGRSMWWPVRLPKK